MPMSCLTTGSHKNDFLIELKWFLKHTDDMPNRDALRQIKWLPTLRLKNKLV